MVGVEAAEGGGVRNAGGREGSAVGGGGGGGRHGRRYSLCLLAAVGLSVALRD
jgi:hypothetical protein